MKDKTIVLIFPRPTRGYKKERRRDVHPIRRIYAPLSIMYLAARLEETGFSVHIFDHRLTTLEEIKEKISQFNDILFIGISTITGSQIKYGLEIAKTLRSIYKDVPLVWGGTHPTIFPEKTILHPLVDIMGYGEGDYTIVELARALSQNKPLDTVSGIYFKKNGDIVKTPPKKIEFLDILPIPSWKPLKEHLNSAQYPIIATITTSRGCPYNCTYCYKWNADKSTQNSQWRAFSVKRVMAEVDYLNKNFGFDIFEAADENLFVHPKRALELIKEFKERGLKIFTTRSNFLTYKDEIVKEFSGFCDYVAYSPETGSLKVQALLNKRADYKKMKLLNIKLRDMNIATVHTFIFGFPFETDEDIKDTVNLCKDFKKINPASRMGLYQYMPYPGAPLTNMMVSKYGLVLPDSFEEWSETDMYGELSLRFRPWIDEKKVEFLNNFQLLFNLVFNTYQPLAKEVWDIYNSSPKIRELMGDISAIPRATKSPYKNILNERITPELLKQYEGKNFV